MTPKNRVFALVTLPICAAILVAGAWLASAGNLSPPAGPVAGTMKTLADVEPRTAINATSTPGDADSLFKISQPGSYYLTANITGVVGKHGIEIAASGVTLDLKGFDLVGVPGMGDFNGVNVSVGGLTNIAVVNGSVRNWGNNGVDLVLAAANCRVDSVLASGNTFYGISTGNASAVTNCSANANLDGIFVNTGSAVTHCSASGNGSFGFSIAAGGTSCTVTNCSASSNGGAGFASGSGCTFTNCSVSSNGGAGISTGSGCTVADCTATSNIGRGMLAGTGCTVTNCSASNNNYYGIEVGADSIVAECTTNSNDSYGILTGSGCTVTNCSATGGNPGIQSTGIGTGSGCTVTNCTAHNNAGWGIDVGADSMVTECNINSNIVYGLNAGARCTVMNCSASRNGAAGVGAGIFVSGNSGRYENNQTVNNLFDGMSFANGTTGNVITRNYSAGNGGFQFRLEGGNVAGVSGPTRNECAPIFTPAAVNGVWLAGNTNPWANMTR